jgi:alginate O-acetyltransferase complex protein AlgI
MIFANLTFLIYFLPIYLICYFSFKTIEQRNWVLIIFSLIFYAWGEPLYLSLLVIYTLFNFYFANKIETTQNEKYKTTWLIISISLSLSSLVYFKYLNFFFSTLTDLTGIKIQFGKIQLPLGISFYTFQSISYTLDVYYEKIKSQKKYFHYLLYISLFHQLIAGPIVRYTDIALQINERKSSFETILNGFYRFSKGLFKKVVFANTAAQIVKVGIPETSDNWNTLGLVIGVVFFAIQIYYDFSGYSDMALGLGTMIGFKYSENFNYPFISKSIKEFWSRWHISLSTFIRDYFYTPINYNLRKYRKTGPYIAVMLAFLASGLWHGASYNFIIWGVYFGILIVLEELILIRLLNKFGIFFKYLYMFIALFFSFALFYFTKFYDLKLFFINIFFKHNLKIENDLIIILMENKITLIIAILLVFPLKIIKNKIHKVIIKSKIKSFRYKFLCTLLFLTISISFLISYSFNPFIYFRF